LDHLIAKIFLLPKCRFFWVGLLSIYFHCDLEVFEIFAEDWDSTITTTIKLLHTRVSTKPKT